MTKHGIHEIIKTLAVELAGYNILINTVCPSFTITELTMKNNTKKQLDEGLTVVLRTEKGLELVHDICRNEVKYAMEQIKSLNKDN